MHQEFGCTLVLGLATEKRCGFGKPWEIGLSELKLLDHAGSAGCDAVFSICAPWGMLTHTEGSMCQKNKNKGGTSCGFNTLS